jgi:uncharacterized protein
MEHYLLLIAAGSLAGTMNAVAGGGSFVTFPVLLSVGLSPITANASSTVALFPGSLTGSWEYREHIRSFAGIPLWQMCMLTLLGGALGAALLLVTSVSQFIKLVPWLLLTGTLAFAFGRQLGNWLRKRVRIGKVTVLSGQFILGIYGGYFGGAVGIMMMAVWSLFGMNDIKHINANKNLLVAVANAIAVGIFIATGKVAWTETGILLVATMIGGFAGARYSKRMNPVLLRKVIVVFNFVITAVFFIKTYY